MLTRTSPRRRLLRCRRHLLAGSFPHRSPVDGTTVPPPPPLMLLLNQHHRNVLLFPLPRPPPPRHSISASIRLYRLLVVGVSCSRHPPPPSELRPVLASCDGCGERRWTPAMPATPYSWQPPPAAAVAAAGRHDFDNTVIISIDRPPFHQ